MARIVHYLNQFFGGLGGEDQAGAPPTSVPHAAGTARGLAQALGEDDRIVATVMCGDNYLVEQGEAAVAEVIALVAPHQPDVVVAGPAFGSGRYGLGCGAVCRAVRERLGIPAITALHPDSPGTEEFRAWVPIVPTTETAAGMGPALRELGRLAAKLGRGEPLGDRSEEGLITRGLRRNVFAEERGSTRAIDLLLAKMSGARFETEWPLPRYERAEPSDPLAAGRPFRLALVSEAGIVPLGNPDRLPSGWATHWARYPLDGRRGFAEGEFESVHGGIDTELANFDPDRQVPLDAARELEAEGRLSLYHHLFSTTGNMGSLRDMTRMGTEMAKVLLADGVQAVIVGST